MAQDLPPHREHHVPVTPPHHPHIPVPVDHGPRPRVTVPTPTPVVRRTAVLAARSTPPTAGGHPAVWAPWATLVTAAEARMKTEVQAAIGDLHAAESAAGRILDMAEAMAKEASSQIISAAWARWNTDMAAAADASQAILDPARTAYEAQLTAAHDRFNAAITSAERVFKSILADADRAKADGQQAQQAS